MKGTLLILVSLLMIFPTSCKTGYGISPGTPRCISDEIENNQKKENRMIDRVEEYQFQDKLGYAFQPDEKKIADGATTIKDANCTTLCNIGGFGGPSVNLCNGENFFQIAVLKRIIWKKK